MSRSRIAQILMSVMTPDAAGLSVAHRLCALATTDLSMTGAGIVLASREGSDSLLASTGATARRLTEAQFAVDEGPAVEALRSRRPVLEPDIAATMPTRWPALAPALAALGVRAQFAFPLQVGAISLGVLDLYRDVSGPLRREEMDDAVLFAEAALSVLLSAEDEAYGTAPGGGQERLYSDLAEVHQATGMVAVQEGVLMVEALLLLRAYAFSEGRPIHQVARDVVSRRMRLDGRPGRDAP